MNIEVMKTFCDLVETGSFSKAAEANYISQSAVSQQLAKLERDFGAQLMNRGGGLVTATDAGQALYRGALEIIRRYEQLAGEVRSVADAIHGVLRVGTIYSVGFYLLEPYVRRFLQDYPEVELHVEYTQWNRIYAAVRSGEMNLGVVAEPEAHRSIQLLPLADEQLVVVCSPDHRFARRKHLRPEELAGETFIGFEPGIPTRRRIDALLAEHGVSVNIALEFDNVETLKRAVEINAGLSILPEDNVLREEHLGLLRYARFRDGEPWVRRLSIVRARGRMPSPAEQKFLSLLGSHEGT
ncbi:MAG: LysR family transcriptional regulator [Phycisphaerae bacterium]|nr:LysR family transcriptional regulator [Phycisphaerae bacterium]